MGKGRKAKHQQREIGVNQDSIIRRVGAVDSDVARDRAPERTIGVIAKLQSTDVVQREEACIDVAAQVLEPAQFHGLFAGGVHRALSHLIADESADVQQAAATALRNFCTTGRDAVIDDVVSQPNFLEAFGRALFAQYDKVTSDDHAAGNSDSAHQRALDEMLQLSTVLAEGSERAADVFSAEPRYLAMLVDCLTLEGPLQVAAAEALNVISSENEAVTAFLAGGLTTQQQELLNAATSQVPVSPSLMRVSVLVSGALLNAAPTLENIQRVLPIVLAASATSPMLEARRVLPLMSQDCQLDEDVRQQGVLQTFDRLRALQTAMDLIGIMVSRICEENDDSAEDDEAAFAANPYSSIVTQSGGLIDSVASCVAAVVAPIEDVIIRGALREACEGSASVTTLQRLYLSAEVAVLGVASSLLHLLPLDAFGDVGTMWNVCVAAISDRLSLCGEGSPNSDELLLLQIESIAEMCWTIQRKDCAGVTLPQPHHLDIFTRVAWERSVSSETRVFVIGTIGAVGARAGLPEVTFVCGKFMASMITSFTDDIDVQAEAANTIMDLFCDERFDESAYKPLDIHSVLAGFTPTLKQHVASLPKRSARREHLAEVADNLTAFAKYKKQNVRW